MNKRLDYIDRAKGILIILVVIGHIWQSGPVHNWIYYFHMPAFFVISGILLNETGAYKKTFGKYFFSRLFAFGIPFIWIEILGCLTDIVRHGITLNPKGYLYNTLLFNFNDGNLWFLMNLFLIELIFFWLIKLLKRKSIIFAAAGCLFVLHFFIPSSNSYITTIRSVLRYDLFFAIGFCGAEVFKKFNITACIVSIISFLVTGMIHIHENSNIILNCLFFLIRGLGGAYAVIQLGKVKLPGFTDRFIIKAGMNTILIYGTHHFYYAVIGALFGITDFNTTPIIPGLIMLIGVALLEIPTIYIVDRWAPWFAGKKKKKATSEK